MTQRKVLDICYAAHTRDHIAAAMEARDRYLADHPDDDAVVGMGEMLCMHAEALDLLGRDHEAAPFPSHEEKEPAHAR